MPLPHFCGVKAKHWSAPRRTRCCVWGCAWLLPGGFLDAYTYLLRGGVFANAQTGNMVLMALYAARRDGRAFYYLLPIAAFLAGVIVTEWLKARLTNAQHIAWQHVVLLAEAILVFAVGFVPRSVRTLW